MLDAAYVGGVPTQQPRSGGRRKRESTWSAEPAQAFSWQWKLITGAQWMLGAAYVGGIQRSNPDPVWRPEAGKYLVGGHQHKPSRGSGS